jgi:L-alanine-DL-glutamate epimerase-like enolase superfamily enzyme
MVSLKPIAEMQAEAEQMAQKGIRTFKLKGGQDLRKDIGMITGLRKALGEEVGLYVDANQGYALSEALRFFKACEEMGILCVEEPVPVFQGSVRKRIARSSSDFDSEDDSCFTLEQVIKRWSFRPSGSSTSRLPAPGTTCLRRLFSWRKRRG